MTILRLDQAAKLYLGGAEMAAAWHNGVQVWAKPAAPGGHPLLAHVGTNAGQMTVLTDMLWPGSYTSDGVAVSAVSNLGGTGAAHGMSQIDFATAPRLASGAMQFRPGDQIRFANEHSMVGVHVIFEALLKNPGFNESQHIISHDGSVSAGRIGHIQYVRQNANNRLRIKNDHSSEFTTSSPLGFEENWAVLEVRYAWSGVSADPALVDFAVSGSPANNRYLPGGGDLYVNRLGNNMRNQMIGAVIMINTSPGNTMSSPEAAVVAARNYLIGRRA